MDDTPAIATITCYDDLIAVCRQRMAQLQITFETLDSVSGVQPGYSAKLLGPNVRKTFGPVSFCAIMGALGLQLLAVEDRTALSRLGSRLVKRRYRPQSSVHWRQRHAVIAGT